LSKRAIPVASTSRRMIVFWRVMALVDRRSSVGQLVTYSLLTLDVSQLSFYYIYKLLVG
ncbi:MAG: hypothetical protein ACI8RD_010222, partial [Bacillariaceae sp.]